MGVNTDENRKSDKHCKRCKYNVIGGKSDDNNEYAGDYKSNGIVSENAAHQCCEPFSALKLKVEGENMSDDGHRCNYIGKIFVILKKHSGDENYDKTFKYIYGTDQNSPFPAESESCVGCAEVTASALPYVLFEDFSQEKRGAETSDKICN